MIHHQYGINIEEYIGRYESQNKTELQVRDKHY